MNYFFDSSALIKRYVPEEGSARAMELLGSASSMGISVICVAEVISGLCRRRREGKLPDQEYEAAKEVLLADAEGATVIHLTDRVLARAVGLLERFVLRSADALQVASALEWSTDLFVSADDR